MMLSKAGAEIEAVSSLELLPPTAFCRTHCSDQGALTAEWSSPDVGLCSRHPPQAEHSEVMGLSWHWQDG